MARGADGIHRSQWDMRHKIIKPIGSGSFGTIYEVLAEHEENGRSSTSTTKCVMKELTKIDLLSRKRFEREIKVLSELDHPNIVNIIYWDIGGDSPRFLPYYIMEYLKGGSLRTYMNEKFLSDHRFVFESTWAIDKIVFPICNALAQAHSSNVYHRDLKPDNIMFTDKIRSNIKVADWGLVKGNAIDKDSLELTAVRSEGQIGRTPGYCSPEQWFMFNKDDIDGRSDIYSLGIIFYEMLTRRRPAPYDTNDPFTAQQQIGPALSIMSKQKKVDPPSKFNPSIASQLDNCILRMIQIDPNKRQNSVWELMTEFDMMR
jgi:serine/threonine protein kinase